AGWSKTKSPPRLRPPGWVVEHKKSTMTKASGLDGRMCRPLLRGWACVRRKTHRAKMVVCVDHPSEGGHAFKEKPIERRWSYMSTTPPRVGMRNRKGLLLFEKAECVSSNFQIQDSWKSTIWFSTSVSVFDFNVDHSTSTSVVIQFVASNLRVIRCLTSAADQSIFDLNSLPITRFLACDLNGLSILDSGLSTSAVSRLLVFGFRPQRSLDSRFRAFDLSGLPITRFSNSTVSRFSIRDFRPQWSLDYSVLGYRPQRSLDSRFGPFDLRGLSITQFSAFDLNGLSILDSGLSTSAVSRLLGSRLSTSTVSRHSVLSFRPQQSLDSQFSVFDLNGLSTLSSRLSISTVSRFSIRGFRPQRSLDSQLLTSTVTTQFSVFDLSGLLNVGFQPHRRLLDFQFPTSVVSQFSIFGLSGLL
ncbi:Unknown protein, partial [Striga hermonthica]